MGSMGWYILGCLASSSLTIAIMQMNEVLMWFGTLILLLSFFGALFES